MNQEELYTLIESYLAGSLSEAQKREVEERMEEDPAFRQEVELQKELQATFEDPARMALRGTLAGMMEDASGSNSPSNNKSSFNWKNGLGLLSIVLILGLVAWKWLLPAISPSSGTSKPTQELLLDSLQNNSDTQNAPGIDRLEEDKEDTEAGNNQEELDQEPTPTKTPPERERIVADAPDAERGDELLAMATDLYETYPPSISLATRSARDAAITGQIERNFREEKFIAVIAALDSLPNLDNTELTLLAHAYFKNGQYDKASDTFKTIIDRNNPALTEEVEFFYLLSLLAQSREQEPDFIQQMETILADPDRAFYTEAKGLKEKLDNQ
jgi:tetratricopeptide (TPR) repeat protein